MTTRREKRRNHERLLFLVFGDKRRLVVDDSDPDACSWPVGPALVPVVVLTAWVSAGFVRTSVDAKGQYVASLTPEGVELARERWR